MPSLIEKPYELEKWEWTEADFEVMGWHDCPVYALRVERDIYLDLDYIFKWSDNAEEPFTFWIAPATLVFENPYYYKIDLASDFLDGFEISHVSKLKGEKEETIWSIETHQGEIKIWAENYRQIIRRPPSFQVFQEVPKYERGNISFSLTPEKKYKANEDVTRRKEEDFKLYQLAMEKRNLIIKMTQLDKDLLGTKHYLLTTREIKQRLKEIQLLLNQTDFQNWGEIR